MANLFTRLFRSGGEDDQNLFTAFKPGSDKPFELGAKAWVEHTQDLLKEPYTDRDADCFIRCCNANLAKLQARPDVLKPVMEFSSAALTYDVMGGQEAPQKLVDFVTDVLGKMQRDAKIANTPADPQPVSGTITPPSGEDRPLKEGELGVIGRDGSRSIVAREEARAKMRDGKGKNTGTDGSLFDR